MQRKLGLLADVDLEEQEQELVEGLLKTMHETGGKVGCLLSDSMTACAAAGTPGTSWLLGSFEDRQSACLVYALGLCGWWPMRLAGHMCRLCH